MKKLFLFVCVVAAVLTACRHEDSGNMSVADGMSALRVSFDIAGATKATGEVDESGISTVQVFCFDPSLGILEDYGTSSGQAVTLSVGAGTKHVYALVNGPSLSSVSDENGLLSAVSALADNSLGSFQMFSPTGDGAVFEVAGPTDITLKVKRIVSKVMVEKVVAAFEKESLRSLDFIVTDIYLADVVSSTSYDLSAAPAGYLDGSDDNGAAVNGMICDSGLSYNLKNSGSSSVRHSFYAYPNATSRKTVVVVEATLGGQAQKYSFELPALQRNMVYDVTEVKITRPGGETHDVEFTVEVADWDGTDVISDFSY